VSIRIQSQLRAQPPRNILVICTQRIGDVLLSTPVVRSLKAAWPDSAIDVLVLPGTQDVLDGNPDIRHVIALPQRVRLTEKLKQFAGLWRRYDLAVATMPTDRARLFARAAAPLAVGFTTPEEAGWVKRRFLDANIPFDNLHTHTVQMGLRLLEPLGISPRADVQPPRASPEAWAARTLALGIDTGHPYAVVHPNPKFRYKMWTQAKWVDFIGWLRAQGLGVYLTGSNDPAEARYVEEIASAVSAGCVCLAGQLSLAETTMLLETAHLYAGPDTAVTHLSAATGTPTIALFGPSNPVKWGPWPKGWNHAASPWARVGSARQGNVWLIQGPGDCVPCLLEGCDRHLDSDSRCLIDISVAQVTDAARQLLETP